ncbi:type II toxin-antitoxin system RelB/DinJ family antitoxin [Enterococcus hulanensis]|uniref:type II toxin-antitoxin system RelB/DinJ family antitoxin n=1 Tax=Enterococcus hulanensis TaxID=2559929 RepID=UPI0028928A90|nr:type II toxin-antitoxin system RelB/DinJ family antitoxin [Enterococcus hulanensis]MDT2659398.1 type II toxin-antitoxin system RelB/DinJ family antitoxin [Enterococcus hulanensis]
MKKKKERIQVGIDKQLKETAEMILGELGMNPTTAITILYKQVVERGEFPIDIKLSEDTKQDIRLRQLTKQLPIKMLETEKEIAEWLDEE